MASPATQGTDSIVPPPEFGLSYTQKLALEPYFAQYLAGATKAGRRAVTVRAAKALIRTEKITSKEDAVITRNVCVLVSHMM